AEFLCNVMGMPEDGPRSVELRAARHDAVLMGEQYSRAWCDLLDAECSAHPLVLLLEDFHWGDLPSVKLLGAALRRLSEKPLLVLAFARPGIHALFPKMWLERGVQEVRLAPLSRKAQERFVAAALPDVDAARLAEIVERAAGNPFFLEELVRVAVTGTSAS